jgi:hypothetical protein
MVAPAFRVRARTIDHLGREQIASAFLGPLLLVLSKRRDAPLAAALIDWRLFENPYLYLEDIALPVLDVHAKEQVLTQLPAMALIIVSTRTRDAERPPLLPRWSVGARTSRLAGMMINARFGARTANETMART